MITLLNSLYNLLCFITEDCMAHNLHSLQKDNKKFQQIIEKIKDLTTDLEYFLDDID